MNNRIQLLLNKLRTSKVGQSKNCLKTISGCFCVEGLMIELYIEQNPNTAYEFKLNDSPNLERIVGEPYYNLYNPKSERLCSMVPPEIRSWYGLPVRFIYQDVPMELHELNDLYNLSFAQIADIIEVTINEQKT